MSEHPNIQSVLFDKHFWTEKSARAWLKQHKFKYNNKVDITENFFRFRQVSPKKFKNYYIKKLKNNIELVIGYSN